jgi:hypothetical protein
MAVASALALGLQPIPALARQPEEVLKQQAGEELLWRFEMLKESTRVRSALNSVSANREYST